jgi:hypothetical protein
MLAGDLKMTARQRQTEPPKLIHLVRGDLDWIVMKALEKDRTRRYETANGLAVDIQRHLNAEPVVACPPSNLYKFQKWVRRNKLLFVAGSAVAAALLIGLGAAIVAVVRIQREDQQIRQAKDDATEKLWGSYLAEARANRTSPQTGQRFASLETVQKAAAIRSDLAVRNEVIACLAMSDLRVAKQTVVTGHARNELATMALDLEHYAFWDTNGNVTIWAASNGVATAVLSVPGYAFEAVIGFSPNGKYLTAAYRREHEGESELIWDVEEQKLVLRALQQEDGTNQSNLEFPAEYSPDSQFFFGTHPDGSIRIMTWPPARRLNVFPAPPGSSSIELLQVPELRCWRVPAGRIPVW